MAHRKLKNAARQKLRYSPVRYGLDFPTLGSYARAHMKQKAYARAGVDVDLGNKVKSTLPRLLAAAQRPEVLGKRGELLREIDRLVHRTWDGVNVQRPGQQRLRHLPDEGEGPQPYSARRQWRARQR